MKKAPTKSQRKWVQTVIDKWRPRLFLGEWMFNVSYMVDDLEDKGHPVAASNTVNEVYLQSAIKIYPAFWIHTDVEREEIIVHELAHCQTQKVWNMLVNAVDGAGYPSHVIRDTIEKLTQRITNIAFQQEWK